MDIRAEWKRGPVLFDGAMGTYFAQNHPGERCELASLTARRRFRPSAGPIWRPDAEL